MEFNNKLNIIIMKTNTKITNKPHKLYFLKPYTSINLKQKDKIKKIKD